MVIGKKLSFEMFQSDCALFGEKYEKYSSKGEKKKTFQLNETGARASEIRKIDSIRIKL